MIKISALSYLNAIPFIYGLKQGQLINQIELGMYCPAVCADKLLNGEVDLALVPVVIIPLLQESHIISDYCIGANGAVETVCLYSDVPICDVESITLDYQSKTSVTLLKILLKEYWRLKPEFRIARVGFEKEISGKDAGLVIGDRAFDLDTKHKYVYDLSAIWKEMTGLPFVFAAWVSNKELPEKFILQFNKSLKEGLDNIDMALIKEGVNYPHCKNPSDYLNNKISYKLDNLKLEAMNLFLQKI